MIRLLQTSGKARVFARLGQGCQSPQSNGICERFHKVILQEFYQVAFRKKI